MAQPPPYIPTTDFIPYTFAQSFPGQQLNVEFNNIKTTFLSTLANIQAIQRDDTALANQAVDFPQLSPAVAFALGQVTLNAVAPSVNLNPPTFSSMQTAVIGPTVQVLSLLGYLVAGDGGQASYVRTDIAGPADGKFQTKDGQWWVYVPENRGVNARAFGAIADATNVNTSSVVTGTDSAPAIQSAINFALRNNIRRVFLPSGTYRTNDTLHLGYGDGFYSVNLEGDHYSFAGATAGTTILFTATDGRQCVNIQGGRQTKVEGIAFVFPVNQSWFLNNVAFRNLFSPTRSDWVDPALTTALNQHSPLACITIDAFSGSTPGDPYPAVSYPAWTGFSHQYNGGGETKYLTSGPRITRCAFLGFPVAIAIGVNTDNQGDFLRVEDSCSIQYSAVGVAACNTQSRNIAIRDLDFAYCHTVLTNVGFGSGNGEWGGPIENIAGGQAYQIFDFTKAGFTGPLLLSDIYCEGLTRYGTIGSGSSGQNGIKLVGWNIALGDYDYPTGTGTAPRALIEVVGELSVYIENNIISAGPQRLWNLVWGASAQVILGPGNIFNGGLIWTDNSVLGYQAASFGGGIILNGGANNPFQQNRVLGASAANYVLPGGGGFHNTVWADDQVIADGAASTALVREGLRSFRDVLSGTTWNVTGRRAAASAILKSGLSSVSQTLDTLTFHYPSATPHNNPNDFMIEVGDILVDFATLGADQGTLFVVTAVTGGAGAADYVITALQTNNYNAYNQAFTPNVDVTVSGGLFRLIKTAVYMPTRVYWGNFTKGSSTVANVGVNNGNGTSAASFLPTGMLLYAGVSDDTASGSNAVGLGTFIGTVTNGSPASLTIVDYAGSAKTATATGRFPLLPVAVGRTVRLGPPTPFIATGLSGAGAVTLTGAAVGDHVMKVYDQNAAAWVDVTANFEGTITVANQIQETVSVSGHQVIVFLQQINP